MPLPLTMTLRVASAPSLFTTVSSSGPRSPFSSARGTSGMSVHRRRGPSAPELGSPPAAAPVLRGRSGINPPAFEARDPPTAPA